MNKERIDDLVDILADEYAQLENTFVIKNNQQLLKYLDNPEGWKQSQFEDRNKYKGILIGEAKARLSSLNAKTTKVFLMSYKEVAKDQIKITEKEIIGERLPQEVREQLKQMKEFNAEQIAKLANQSLLSWEKQVDIVNSLSTPDKLYDTVKQQMKIGIDKGIKQTYSNGRQVSWKAYMEMNIRTTIQQEISRDQVMFGARVGQIFYMCDGYADAAPDHAPYQLKVYYNREVPNIPPKIMEWIVNHKIMSMQEAMDAPIYLTTRPNCRHNFHAIPLSEAMGMSLKDIAEKYDLSTGPYKGSNYEKLQEQRKNERMIRKLKLRKENQKEVNNAIGSKGWLDYRRTNQLLKKYRGKQIQLIKENPKLLKREYDRENAKVITRDLGVRLDYKVDNGELVKK